MRRRLLASYLALTLVVLILLEVPLAVAYGDRVRQQVTTGLQRDAFMIANYSEETLEGDAHAPIQRYVDDYARRTDSDAVVVDVKGRLVAASTKLVGDPASISRRPDVQAALRGQTASGVENRAGRRRCR